MEQKVAELLNQQINKEFYSAYLYLDMSNYYDEQEHLEKLNSALIAYEANADMIMM